jgi:hypothetical protein
MQVVARVDDVLGVALPYAAVFDQPTVAGLSSLVLSVADDAEAVRAAARLYLEVLRIPGDDGQRMLRGLDS